MNPLQAPRLHLDLVKMPPRMHRWKPLALSSPYSTAAMLSSRTHGAVVECGGGVSMHGAAHVHRVAIGALSAQLGGRFVCQSEGRGMAEHGCRSPGLGRRTGAVHSSPRDLSSPAAAGPAQHGTSYCKKVYSMPSAQPTHAMMNASACMMHAGALLQRLTEHMPSLRFCLDLHGG
jgi:hypothetical protein